MLSKIEPAFGVYIHWPFCKSKCPYCDFNSHVCEKVDQAAWAKGYEKELASFRSMTGPRTVTSIFFGGGTPSLMLPETVASILATIHDLWDVCDTVEITLEANPTSVETKHFAGYASVGVNRVSLGVQALDDAALKQLGRQHSASDALIALDVSNQYFERTTFDLIYARPDQTVVAWEKELKQALTYAKGHMSLYQLTIEEGTQFHTLWERGDLVVPDSDLAADLYEVTQDIMNEAGMPAYEISNHAAAGQESRHNLVYWRYQDYVGAGPGAHGRLTLDDGRKIGTRTHRAPEIWLNKVDEQNHALHPFEDLGAKQRFQEMMMMGLRLHEGVSIAHLSSEAGEDWRDFINQPVFEHLVEDAYLEQTPDTIKALPNGRQCLNAVLGKILN